MFYFTFRDSKFRELSSLLSCVYKNLKKKKSSMSPRDTSIEYVYDIKNDVMLVV